MGSDHGTCDRYKYSSVCNLEVRTPDFVFSELRKHNKEFIQKSGLDEDDYISAVGVL
jgi:predicted nucleic acid-binding protein